MMNKNKETPSSPQSGRNANKRLSKKPPLPTYRRGPFSWLIIAIIVFTAMMMLQQGLATQKLPWDEFVAHLQQGHIAKIIIEDTEIKGEFREGMEGTETTKDAVTFKVNYRPESGAKERLNEILYELEKKAV